MKHWIYTIKAQSTKTEILIFENELIEKIWQNSLFQKHQCVILTDSAMKKRYSGLLKASGFPILTITKGKIKSLQTVEILTKKLLKIGMDRDGELISFGGGEVSDLGGILTSLYMRGMEHIIIPTTLVGMADASIGGKNGINIGNIKNILGTIRQPHKIIIHPKFLDSLPEEEFKNGMAEVIKIAAMQDKKLFKFIEQNAAKIRNRHPKILNKLIEQSVKLKMGIIKKDTWDQGKRLLLNYGHTIGHAVEISSRKTLSHGRAVAVGMVSENEYWTRKKLLKNDLAQRIREILNAFGLPTKIMLNKKIVQKAIMKDKKKHAYGLRLPIITSVGKGDIITITHHEIKNLLA